MTNPSRSLSHGRLAFLRSVIAGRQSTHSGETGQAHRSDRGLAAACDHHIGLIVLDQAEGVTDGIRGRGTGRCHGTVGAFESEVDGDVSAGGVDHQLRDHERRNTIRATIEKRVVLSFDFVKAADSAADQNTVTVGVAFGEVHSRLKRQLDWRLRSQTERTGRAAWTSFPGDVDLIADVEVSKLSAKADLVV